MKTKISIGEFDEVNEQNEKDYAEHFEFYPIPPVTIDKLEMDMEDSFNGYIYIKLSNGDVIEYTCQEDRKSRPPGAKIYVKVNDHKVMDNKFLEQYCGRKTWVEGVLNFYIDWKNGRV